MLLLVTVVPAASQLATTRPVLLRRCPQVLAMERNELIARLVGMKVGAQGPKKLALPQLAYFWPDTPLRSGWTCPAAPKGPTPPSLQASFPPAQALFPGSDVARMVELAPASFLEGDWPPKALQLEEASALLRRELCGADLDFMFQVGWRCCALGGRPHAECTDAHRRQDEGVHGRRQEHVSMLAGLRVAPSPHLLFDAISQLMAGGPSHPV